MSFHCCDVSTRTMSETFPTADGVVGEVVGYWVHRRGHTIKKLAMGVFIKERREEATDSFIQ